MSWALVRAAYQQALLAGVSKTVDMSLLTNHMPSHLTPSQSISA